MTIRSCVWTLYRNRIPPPNRNRIPPLNRIPHLNGNRRMPLTRPDRVSAMENQEEKEAVERRLNWFVRKLVVPGLDYCRAALKEEPALSSRTWRDVKYCVYNMIQRRKRHGDCAEDSD
ncbi:hypothetical protein FJT64_015804 [Amphibalanus amphitrite]|uniref:Uncharacterized protein n=1 Tax=Amphibalanus amphitrite TaxID=1232801 RepID=A0A6A4X322_AMPAM|nr:hypothetical protein FJT64_015804 [Amphibalanus amphitrite]